MVPFTTTCSVSSLPLITVDAASGVVPVLAAAAELWVTSMVCEPNATLGSDATEEKPSFPPPAATRKVDALVTLSDRLAMVLFERTTPACAMAFTVNDSAPVIVPLPAEQSRRCRRSTRR